MSNTRVPNYPGSVRIEEVIHNNGTDAEDITKIVTVIDIHSDINISSSFCQLAITDFSNWLEKRQFAPGDVVSLSLSHSDKSYERKYRIKCITDINNLENGKTYRLHLVSELEYASFHTIISRAYEGLPSVIAKTILEGHTFELADNWETSSNNISYIAPAVSPIKAIDWLARNSYVPEMNERMTFFQDSQQFWHFTSISNLRKLYNGTITYRYNANTLTDTDNIPKQEEMLYSIKHLNFHDAFDIYKDFKAGFIKNTFFTMDPTTKTLAVNSYNYWEDYAKKSLNPRMMYKEEEYGVGKMTTSYATSLSTRLPEFRVMYDGSDEDFKLTGSQRIEISVPGNHMVDIGQIITVEIPSQETTSKSSDSRLDETWSGKYYVVGKRDQITNEGHGMALRLVKDSFI